MLATSAKSREIPKDVPFFTVRIILAPCSAGRASIRFIAGFTGLSTAGVMKFIRGEGEKLKIPVPEGEVTEVEIDETRHFIGKKKSKIRLRNAIDRDAGKVIAFSFGGRGVIGLKGLIEVLKKRVNLKRIVIYTDDWPTYSKISIKCGRASV